MSEAVRDLSGAVANAGRSASQTLLRAAGSFTKGKSQPETFEPANETALEPARPDPSVISAATQMKGSITTEDELHVHGKMDGDIRASKIIVCTGGVVKGDLTAEAITIHGTVEGRINGTHVLLGAGAMVKGEITHSTMGVDTAAIFEGSVKRRAAAE